MYAIVMGKILYYMIAGIMCILFFMKWGRIYGLNFGKNGKGYTFVFRFLTILLILLLLMLSNINPFDKVDYFLRLKFTNREYVYDTSNLNKKEGVDYIYYVDASAKGKELAELLNKIVKKEDFYVEYDIERGYYCIKKNEINYGNIVVERKGLLKKVSVKWDHEKLELMNLINCNKFQLVFNI